MLPKFSTESGASDNKCLETYHGPEAFSEIEMKNIRDYVLALEPTPILALCLHSYSQLWMYPYGYATGVFPDNVKEIVSWSSKNDLDRRKRKRKAT